MPLPRRARRLLIVAVPVAVAVAGLLADWTDPFPALRYAIRRTADEMPSSRIVAASEVARGAPLLSIYTDQEVLYDSDTGLLTHPLKKGREWERPAFVSYFDRGDLMFGSEVGLRVHGGKSRVGSPVQSYRIYLRGGYGADRVPARLLYGGRADPVTRFVAHNDLRKDGRGLWWHLVNPFAYDIARRLGSLAPFTQPVRFFLNGEFQGVYVITEHLKEPYLITHFGHDHFAVGDLQTLDRLRRQLRQISPLTVPEVERIVDLDNLSRWFVGIIFCATSDPFQALMVRDETHPGARWLWINWDMDHSFMDFYRLARVPWEHDTFRIVRDQRHPMSDIFTRLLAEDATYKSQFTRLFVDMLNHRISPAFLDERYEHYRRIAESYGVRDREYLPVLRQFLTNRPAFVRGLMTEYLGAGPSYRSTITGPPGLVLRIDGYYEPLPYTGWYPQGLEIRIEVPPDRTSGFSHWVVNGRRIDTPRPVLWHRIGEETAIEAVYR